MHTAPHHARGYQAAVWAAVMSGWLAATAPAAELMPPAQQNALVRKYCAVCHRDTLKNGGLSLEHFDAAQVAPGLAAMMLSKLSGGVSLEMVRAVSVDANAAALVSGKARSGAMGAAGIPVPDQATVDALIHALAVESAGASGWTVEHAQDGTARTPGLTASILREAPSAGNAGEARAYRLIVSCDLAAREGFVKLAWSPVPRSGELAASADGKPAIRVPVEGSEKMGNGSGVVTSGLAAVVLAKTQRKGAGAGFALPEDSLVISELFPDETVTFSFAGLPNFARREFAACFPGVKPARR